MVRIHETKYMYLCDVPHIVNKVTVEKRSGSVVECLT